MPALGQVPAQPDLLRRIGGIEDRDGTCCNCRTHLPSPPRKRGSRASSMSVALGSRFRGNGEGGVGSQDTQSACTAFSTSATCPGTLTLCQTLRMTPSLSIRKVARSMPMYLRPYMLFSTQTP